MHALLVAAEPAIRQPVEQALRRRGHRVTVLADPEAAAAACRAGECALIVVDRALPAVDLLAFCRHVRDPERRVLLVVTADARPERVAALLAAGADDYLVPPLDAAYLDARFAVAERRAARLAPGGAPGVDHRALVGRIPVVTYVTSVDPPGVPLYVSPRIEALTGYSPATWLADPGLWIALLDPQDRAAVLAERRRTSETGEPFRAEYRLRPPDGRGVWVRDEAAVVRDEAGAPRFYHGVVLDITERKAAEEALRRSEARFRSLVRNALDVITVLEANGTIRYESPAVERILGYDPTELVGRNALDLIHPDDAGFVRDTFADAVRAPRAQATLAFRFRHADGSWRWLEAVGTNLLDDPNLRGLVVNSRDVTAAREADAALRASEERLRLALDNVGMGTWEWDVASGEVAWSEHVGPLYGLPRGTPGIAAGDFFALVHGDDRARVRDADARALADGTDYQAEFRVVWSDGTVRWLEGRGRATARDEQGRATRVLGVTMDATARKEAEEALRASERRYRALFAAARRQTQELALLDEVRTALAREVDLPTMFRVVVEAIARTFGYDLVSLYLVRDRRLHLQHQVGYHRVLDRVPVSQGVMGRVARTGEAALVADGRADPDFMAAFEGIVSEVCVPFRDEGRVVGVLNVERAGGEALEEADLRLMLALVEHVEVAVGRARLDAEVRANEARFRGAFDHAPIGMALVGTDGRWLRVNRALCAMLGYAEDELLATTFQNVTHPDDLALDLEQARRLLIGDVDAYAIEKRYLHRRGHAIWAQLHVSLVRDDEGRPRYFVSQIQDVTERKGFEERLEHLALHDPLTGLPNRVLFADRLERALAAPRGRGQAAAVLFVDLDRFKLVNDTLGHETGDRLLADVGRRLAAVLRPVDTIARLGGDEFAVLLDGATATTAARAAERVIEALRPPFDVDGRETFVSASVGIALGRAPGANGRVAAAPRPKDLLREADIALYQAKAAGRGTYARFDPRMAPVVVSGFEQDVALRRAVEREEFRLFWQPQVDLATGTVVGLEALVRWEHPERGVLSPDHFIGLAEETGIIVPLGRWALRAACRQARAWAERHPATAGLTVSVNLSTRQFRRPALAAEVAAAVEESGLDPRRLELEITESVVVEDDPEVERTLATLRRLGVRLAIDDFGTGYSSLRYLHRLAVDVLKLDQGFVAGLGKDPVSLAIVRAVTGLAHELGMTLVAEGIETTDQLERLRRLGVDRGQGFWFARPLAAVEIDALLGKDADGGLDRLLAAASTGTGPIA